MNKNAKLTVFYDHIINAAKQEGMDVEQVARMVASAGISGTEMDYWMLKEEGDDLHNMLKACGVGINCCYLVLDMVNNPMDDRYIEAVDRLNRLGIENMLIVPGFTKECDEMSLIRAQERILPGLIKLVKYAESKGIKVHMEDYDDISAPFATWEQVKWFLDRVPELGLAFDTGNFLYSEEDALVAYEELKDRVTYVHCKDRSFAEVEGEDYKATIKGRKMYSAAVGSGIIPMREIIAKLLEDGYLDMAQNEKKTFALEHFGSLKQLDDMKKSALFMTGVL